MTDIRQGVTTGLEKHHVPETEGTLEIENVSRKIPNIVRLALISKKLRSKKDRISDTETEKDDLEEYLVDSQAKIDLLKEIIGDTKDSTYSESIKAVTDWENLFQELVSYYYGDDKSEFEDKVSERLAQLEEPVKEKNNQSYKQRLQTLLENPRFKKFLNAKVSLENPSLSEATIKEFLEIATSFNLFKILNKIEPKVSRKFKNKENGSEREFVLEETDIKEIKKQIVLKIEEAEKVKNSQNPDITELRKIDKEIKKLLAPILRKISLVYRPEPGKKLNNSEGTSLADVILNNEAACGGAAEIIRVVTEYLGLEGRSIYYPGHVNYEIQLPSGDILLNDSNGNFGINPETGEAQGAASKYYKTLSRVENFQLLTDEEKRLAYRRLNSEGEVEYYLPEDGENYPFLQFGRISSNQAVLPQALVSNMPQIFYSENPEEGFNFINQVYLENNPYGAELQTGIENVYELSQTSLKNLFERMLQIDPKTIFTCQKTSFVAEQLSMLPASRRREIILEGQKYLSDLLIQDPEFFKYLKLHANLYLFEKMLLQEGIGNPAELRGKVESAILEYENEIEKFKIEEDGNMNREYQERNQKIKNKIGYLKELLTDL